MALLHRPYTDKERLYGHYGHYGPLWYLCSATVDTHREPRICWCSMWPFIIIACSDSCNSASSSSLSPSPTPAFWPHNALPLSQERLHLHWSWPTCFLLRPAHQPSMWFFFYHFCSDSIISLQVSVDIFLDAISHPSILTASRLTIIPRTSVNPEFSQVCNHSPSW